MVLRLNGPEIERPISPPFSPYCIVDFLHIGSRKHKSGAQPHQQPYSRSNSSMVNTRLTIGNNKESSDEADNIHRKTICWSGYLLLFLCYTATRTDQEPKAGQTGRNCSIRWKQFASLQWKYKSDNTLREVSSCRHDRYERSGSGPHQRCSNRRE